MTRGILDGSVAAMSAGGFCLCGRGNAWFGDFHSPKSSKGRGSGSSQIFESI